MRRTLFFFLLGLWILPLLAEDFTTLDGKTYTNATIVKVTPDGIQIMNDSGGAKLKFKNLPEDVRKKYNYDPYECAMVEAESPKLQITMKKTDAFSLSQLEEAKKKAAAEGKPIGFIVTWDTFFNAPTNLTDDGSVAALAQFYYVFHNDVVLVFVSHERELNASLPEAVKKGVFGPDAGGFSPKMALTDPTVTEYIGIIPYGRERATAKERQPLFRDGIAKIRAAQARWAAAPPPEVEKK